MALVFISHSSKDNQQVEKYTNRIEKYFGEKPYFLDVDDEAGLTINEEWEKELYSKLKKSKIALFFISKNWIDSCWCQKEFSIAKTLGKEVIATSIESDETQKSEVFNWIGQHIQQCDIEGDEQAFEKILKRIDKLSRILYDKPYADKWDENRNPYPGLEAFDEDKAAVFFGREDEIDEIVADLQGIYHKANTKAYIVVGASGMGKSSLLKAGVLPILKKLEEYRNKWEVLDTFRPQKKPFVTFLAQMLQFVDMRDDFDAIYEELTSGKKTKYLDKLTRQLTLKHQSKNILFPIDQAEEFFTVSHKEEKKLFFKLLVILMEECSNFYTIWTMRSDYIGVFQEDEALGMIHPYHTIQTIAPLKKEEISTIIKYPAEKSDLMIEESLIERLKNDLQDTKALPLLAYTLNELAKPFFKNHTKTQRIITVKDYENLARGHENPIYMIIEKKIDEIFKNKHQIDTDLTDEKLEALLKELFIYHLIDVKSDGNIAKKSAQSDTLSSDTQKVIQHFIDERLLVSKQQDGENVIEIAHESIITNWKLLQKWIDEEKEFLIFRSQLELFYDEWMQVDRSDKALLGGLNLEKAVSFRDMIHGKKYIEFIDRSKEYTEEQERKYRELYNNAIRETQKANHNISLTFLEKAKSAQIKKDFANAILYAHLALNKINDSYDTDSTLKAQARGIIQSFSFFHKIQTFQNHSTSSSISISTDGKILASGLMDNTIELWEISCGKHLATLQGHESAPCSVVFSPDGKILASGSADGMIKLWNVFNGKLFATLQGEGGQIRRIAFSPDGKMLVAGIRYGTIVLWDVSTYKILKTFQKKIKNIFNKNEIRFFAIYYRTVFSFDGKKLISYGVRGNTIDLWDIQRGKIISTFQADKIPGKFMNFSNGGKMFVSVLEDNVIKLWDIKSGKLLSSFQGHKDSITNIDFSADNKILISASEDNIIKVWETETGNLLISFQGHKDFISSIGFSPDGKTFASGSFGEIKLWEVHNGKFDGLFQSTDIFVKGVKFSLDGKKFASTDLETIKIFDEKSRKPLLSLSGHKKSITSIDFSSDSKMLISGSKDKTIMLWDTDNGKPLSTIHGHEDTVLCVAFSPDGTMFVSGSEDKTIKLWETYSGKLLFTLNGHTKRIVSIVFSPDGGMVISASWDSLIKLWETHSGKLLATFDGHKHALSSIAFSPDGTMLASGSYDETIKLWEIHSGRLLATFQGHTDKVRSIAFSPDGTMLASGSDDKTIKLWEIYSKKLLATLHGNGKNVVSIDFSFDGKMIISGYGDNIIRLWKLDNIFFEEAETYEQYIINQQLKVKLDAISLVPANISFEKPLWSKNHPFYWLEKAEVGDAEAMYQLGIIYDKDGENQKALDWYKRSAGKGHSGAKERVVFLEEWMRKNKGK